jgi:hypothetical protein
MREHLGAKAMPELIDGELAHDAKLCSYERPTASHARHATRQWSLLNIRFCRESRVRCRAQ